MQAIVIADGTVGTRDALDAAWPGWARDNAVVIAADGGARHAEALGLRIDRWVGDADSLGEEALAELAAAGIPIDRAPTDKDESDAELAVDAALRIGCTELTILGALGGPRLDHALANLGLLSMPELTAIDARLLGVDARVRLLRGPGSGDAAAVVELHGRVGDLVTLLAIGGEAAGVTTSGLRYPLRDGTLREGRSRGLSNVREAPTATVALRAGRLVIVETPATLAT